MSKDHEQSVTPDPVHPVCESTSGFGAARFFRTRGLAQAAVEGGHVQVNEDRVKASRIVRVGDRLSIQRDQERMEVEVTGIPLRRGPAVEARAHYHETAESEAARLRARELQAAGDARSGAAARQA